MNICLLDFIKAHRLHKSYIQDVNCGKYLGLVWFGHGSVFITQYS